MAEFSGLKFAVLAAANDEIIHYLIERVRNSFLKTWL